MNWVPVTTNDVLAVLNSSELTAYQQFRPAAGQSDPLATTIGQVTALAQGYIRRRHTLDAGGGIPQSLVGDMAAIVAYRLLLRCNAKPSDARKATHDLAMETLAKVASGEIGIEAPVTPTTEVTSAPAPSISRHKHHRPGNYVGGGWGSYDDLP